MRISDWSSDVCSSDLTRQDQSNRRPNASARLRNDVFRVLQDHDSFGASTSTRRDDCGEQCGFASTSTPCDFSFASCPASPTSTAFPSCHRPTTSASEFVIVTFPTFSMSIIFVLLSAHQNG